MPVKIIDKIELIEFDKWKTHYIKYLIFNKNKVSQKNIINLWKWLTNKKHPSNIIIAIYKNDIVGHIHYKFLSNPVRGKNIGFIDDIYIDKKYRKSGIAKKLIKHLLKIGKKNKWDVIRWNCDMQNDKAINFYLKFSKILQWHTFELQV